MAGRLLFDEGARTGAGPIVFVSDPTAEAERVARALRSSGITVVDVPLSMLVARVAVQRPQVVLVDSDSHGALDVVARMRELPRADDVHVVFIAAPGGAISNLQDALAHEGSAFYARPIDVPALVREVEALSGVRPGAPVGPAHTSTPPPSIAAPPKKANVSPSLPPASIRSASFPSPDAASLAEPQAAGHVAGGSLGVAPPMSAELRLLLEEAERRTIVHSEAEAAPSPEQELEAVLPAELLAALDEPLEDEDDEAEPVPPTRAPGPGRATRERTMDGSVFRTTGASTGGGATPSINARSTSEAGATPASRPPASHAAADSRGATEPPSPPSVGGPVTSFAPPPVRAGVIDSIAGGAPQVMARAVSARASGCLCFTGGGVERRVVLRDGDIVTCVSSGEDESLIAFLGARGDLPRETVRRLASKFAPFGRHAGAALVARGYLLQNQMWPTLRAHAEWVLGHVLQGAEGRTSFEPQVPGRLAAEPSVFGGSAGAAVFVELMRRVLSPGDAVERLGGAAARLASGAAADLLGECGLQSEEMDGLRDYAGRTVGDVLEGAHGPDFASALFALVQLGIVEVLPPVGAALEASSPPDASAAALDDEAVRERIRARLQVVEDGDYFAVLGVPRDATGYEIRRAFVELRRTFDPQRLLSHDLADRIDDVRRIGVVLEEAYEVLKDSARRERYRRAIEVAPE